MVMLIGLSSKARAGKGSIAAYLVKEHNFVEFSFSDALYKEVSNAFNISIAFLQGADTKDTPSYLMSLQQCRDPDFTYACLAQVLVPMTEGWGRLPLSPRKVLQWWGTEYRRAQDPDYWVKKTNAWYEHAAPERAINTSVRFDNEAAWIRATCGKMWFISRPNGMENDNPGHVSETPLARRTGDGVLVNDGSLADLGRTVQRALDLTIA